MPTLNIPSAFQISSEQFELLAQANQDLRLERTATGELMIMPPTGGSTGRRNADLLSQLVVWNKRTQLGIVFDSSTAFRLPNGGERAPDVSWVRQERWQQLTSAQQDTFPPLCPDFIIELRSPSDSLETLRQKMQEYLNNGLALGWLIDPTRKTVEIYYPNLSTKLINAPSQLSGEPILPEFTMDLRSIW